MKSKKHLFHSVKLFLLISGLTYTSSMYAAAIDPTQPPPQLTEQKKTGPLLKSSQRLTAIFIFPHSKVAIIDGQSVKQGQRIGDYVVSNIKKNEVELTDKQNKRIMLKLAPSVKSMTMNKKGSSS